MNANLYTKKIEMTKSEAKAAGNIKSEKFEELRQYMEMYPGYEIQIKNWFMTLFPEINNFAA